MPTDSRETSTPPGRGPLQPVSAPPSWWQLRADADPRMPLEDDAEVDVCVVGAGVTGCSLAGALAASGAEVAVLDAGAVANGASGRNGGFLLAGLQLRFGSLVDRVGAARAAELYRWSARARDELLAVAEELGAPPGEVARTGSLRLAADSEELAELEAERQLLARHGLEARWMGRGDLPSRLQGAFLGGIGFDADGSMDPLEWMTRLAASAEQAGSRIYEASPVTAITTDGGHPLARLANGCRVRARTVVVCTEAWVSALLPELTGKVLPYRSQVAASEPLDERVLEHAVWSRRGWDYAQQRPDGVIVLGGERIEDAERYRTWDPLLDELDQHALDQWLRRVLDVDPPVTARWAGVLSQSADDFPFVGAVPGRPGTLVAAGWGGAGNVLGRACGLLVAELLTSADRVPPEFSARRLA